MLDGNLTQQDEKRGRKLFCYIRCFLVDAGEVDSFFEYLSKQDHSGSRLPDKPNVNYTFAGEIPWCETFSEDEGVEFSFVTNEETVRVKQMEQELYLNGKRLGDSELDLLLMGLIDDISVTDQENKNEMDIDRIEIRQVPIDREVVQREYINFNAEIPVCDFRWETGKSTVNNLEHATTLSKKIAIDLNLVGQPQTLDLFSREGERATLYLSDQGNDFNNGQSFLFVREDLLESYLQKNNLKLIWAIWGERELSTKQFRKYSNRSVSQEHLYKVFSFVKKMC